MKRRSSATPAPISPDPGVIPVSRSRPARCVAAPHGLRLAHATGLRPAPCRDEHREPARHPPVDRSPAIAGPATASFIHQGILFREHTT